jgi:hypothetical protein
MKKILVLAFAAIALSSCNDEELELEAAQNTATVTVPEKATADAIPAAFKSQPGAPVPAAPAPAPMTTTAPASNTGTGLNPEHGKPGHRCDIAVGAPLNSAPAAQPAATGTLARQPVQIAAPQSTVQPAAPTVVAAGMNPAHGQPGHRCDINVGEPLSTPVKAATSPSAQPQAPVVAAPLQNMPSIPTGSSQSTASLNPAHGQPGHRCDIAVGAPL